MSFSETTRYQAVIAGHITDLLTGEGIPEVTVRLTSPDRNWETTTYPDGFYFFMDLVEGDYALSAEATQFGSRYGTADVPTVTVQRDDGKPVFDAAANVQLQPTRLTGTVTRTGDGQPIMNAVVQVVGSEEKTTTDTDGNYVLPRLQAGAPNIKASAEGYGPDTQNATLSSGQETILNFSLTAV